MFIARVCNIVAHSLAKYFIDFKLSIMLSEHALPCAAKAIINDVVV